MMDEERPTPGKKLWKEMMEALESSDRVRIGVFFELLMAFGDEDEAFKEFAEIFWNAPFYQQIDPIRTIFLDNGITLLQWKAFILKVDPEVAN